MPIRAEGKYRNAVAVGRPHFPLEVATGSLWLGRARSETLNMSPGYAEGVEERLHQTATIRPVVVRELPRREYPVAIRLGGGRSGYRIRCLGARIIVVGSYGEIHLWRSSFQQPFGQVIFQEGGHLVVDILRFARRENQGVAGQSSDGVEPCAAQCSLGGYDLILSQHLDQSGYLGWEVALRNRGYPVAVYVADGFHYEVVGEVGDGTHVGDVNRPHFIAIVEDGIH